MPRPRVLIITASVGEGHDAPARALAAQLAREAPGVEVVTEDCLAVMGSSVAAVSEGAARVVFYRFLWAWDVAFWLFSTCRPTRALTQWLLTRFGARGLQELIASRDPDVVVCVYPNATEVLGRLRRSGRLGVPLCAVVTDVAGLHYWATPGADLHLVTHPEAIPEVHAIAGAGAAVYCVHGFTKPDFLAPPEPAAARAALGLDPGRALVVVSGGGWGVGAIEQTVEVVLAVPGVEQVACLCGRNEELRARLERRFAAEPRVRVEPFTDRMPEWLAAADALVHSTGGLTVLEALMCGCPAISYGWGRGHVRHHNAAFRRYGLAQVADSPAALRAALATVLREGRRRADFSTLPSAASLVVALAERRPLPRAA